MEDAEEHLDSPQIMPERIDSPPVLEIRPAVAEEETIIYIDEDSSEPPPQKILVKPEIEQKLVEATTSFQHSYYDNLGNAEVDEPKSELIEVIDDEPVEAPEVKDEKVEEINKQLESCVLETAENHFPCNTMKSEVSDISDIKDESLEIKHEDSFLDSIDDESNDMLSSRVRRSTRLKSSASRHQAAEPDWSVNAPLPRAVVNLQQSDLSAYSNTNTIESPVLSPNPSISSLSQSFRSFSPEMKVKTRWRKCAELEEQVLQEIGQAFVDPEPETQQVSQDDIDRVNDEIKVDPNDDRLSHFVTIRDNIYLSTKVVCKINKTMKCDCTISEEEIRRGLLLHSNIKV